jgi:hypothetical protein
MQSAPKSHPIKVYNGDIVAGSLLIPESRIIAKLLLDQADENKWQKAIIIDNVLQKKNPATAKRQTRLIRNRLELMTPEFWSLIINPSTEVITQALLAASIKQSHLLGDFLDQVFRDRWRTFKQNLMAKDWEDYMEICAQVDSDVTLWKESTRNKLRQVVFRIFAEAQYIWDFFDSLLQSLHFIAHYTHHKMLIFAPESAHFPLNRYIHILQQSFCRNILDQH